MANATPNSREIQAAFAEYDRQETISNFKVACIIGMTLMPAGVILDYAVYPDARYPGWRLNSSNCGS